MYIPEDNLLFRKLGLTKAISFDLSMTVEEFKEQFKNRVGSETGFFGFSSHKLEFHGEIKRSTFKVSRAATYFNNTDFSLAEGSYYDNSGKTKIEIIAHAPMTGIALSLIILLTIPIIITVLTANLFAALIIWPLALIYLSLFVYQFVRKVKKFLFDLERGFLIWQIR